MTDTAYGDIWREGLWRNNPALVQLLGLCPLLAVTGTAVNGLGLGLATTLVLVVSNVIVSLVRNLVRPEIRIPVFVLVIASAVTTVELGMKAWFHELHGILGIFIPLIVTNCAIIGRAESFASRNGTLPSLMDGLAMGTGFTAVLVTLGLMREALGHGTLFRDVHLMFGSGMEWVTVTLVEDYGGFLAAILPPGAFIGMGLIIALKNLVDARARGRRKARAVVAAPAPNA